MVDCSTRYRILACHWNREDCVCMESWDIEARTWAVGAGTERRFHSCECHQWRTFSDVSGSHAIQYVDALLVLSFCSHLAS